MTCRRFRYNLSSWTRDVAQDIDRYLHSLLPDRNAGVLLDRVQEST